MAVQWSGLGAFIAIVWVQPLVGELRSHKPPGMARKKKKKRKINELNILETGPG